MKESTQNKSPYVRLANSTDALAIATIHVVAWQTIYRGHIPDVILENLSVSKREQQWRDLIEKGTIVLVIEKEQHIVGFASLCASRDVDNNSTRCGEISAIYMHPSIWHQGLGKKLCRSALNQLQAMDFDEVILWVLEGNHQARRFYEAMGFTETGDLKVEMIDANSFILRNPIHTERPIELREIRYRQKIANVFFKPLQETDLDLLCTWLSRPHVKQWWDDHLTDEEIKAKYRKRIGDTIVVPFIVYLNDKPIGFIQYYHADKVGEGWWPDEAAGTIGIDQFIGEEIYLDHGYGTRMIRAMVKKLFENSTIQKIIVDVDPHNVRAIRCYEKSGFRLTKTMNTPDGLANVMELSRRMP